LLGRDNIGLETLPDLLAPVEHRKGGLPRERNERSLPLNAQALFIDRFKHAWPV
jgi:hypothetical protein